MAIMSEKVAIDGYGSGMLELVYCKSNGFAIRFSYGGKAKRKCVLLRRFPHLLKAVRSFRRYVLLSDEIEKGYV